MASSVNASTVARTAPSRFRAEVVIARSVASFVVDELTYPQVFSIHPASGGAPIHAPAFLAPATIHILSGDLRPSAQCLVATATAARIIDAVPVLRRDVRVGVRTGAAVSRARCRGVAGHRRPRADGALRRIDHRLCDDRARAARPRYACARARR